MKWNNPMSRVFSVAMNGDEAVLSGGSSADMAIWFSEKTGKWVSSSLLLFGIARMVENVQYMGRERSFRE